MRSKVLALLLSATFLSCFSEAAPLTVINHSFEDTTGQSSFNEFTFGIPAGWTAYNPSNLVLNGQRIFIGTLNTDGTFFDPLPNPAPDGDLVNILYNDDQKGLGEYGLEQTIGAVLEPLTQYTLEVEVGNIGSGFAQDGLFYDLDDFPGYRIDLFAGTNLVVSDNNSLLIPERMFSNAVLQASIGPNHPGVGEALMIRLVSLNNPLEPNGSGITNDAHEVDFDDVRLDATFSPELFTASNGVSYAVLLDAGLTSNTSSVVEFETSSLLNSDGDVHLDWQEYITGSDPTNSLSFFTHSISNSSNPTLQWTTLSNRRYAISVSTNLLSEPVILTNDLTAGSFADVSATNRNQSYYRVEVELMD